MDYKKIFLSYIIKNFEVTLSGTKSVDVGPYRLNKNTSLLKSFYKIINKKVLKELNCANILAEEQEFQIQIATEIYTHLLQELKTPKAVAKTSDKSLMPLDSSFFETYIPLRDYTSAKQVKMYDVELNQITLLDYEVWKLRIGTKRAQEIEALSPAARFTYTPYKNLKFELLYDKQKIPYTFINLYVIPEWKHKEPSSDRVPSLVTRFLEHLFPVAEDREYVLYWLYHAITSKSYSYLYLQGAQGIGKSILGETIVPALVGMNNSQAASRGDFFNASFNSYLDCKSYIFVDEIRCRSDKEKNELKRLTNEIIQVEKKFEDARDIINHASYILSNNEEFAIHIRPDDRRFSVPKLNTERLEKSLSASEISKLRNSFIEDLDFISRVGHYILDNYNDNKYSNRDVWQKEAFEILVKESATSPYSFILNYIFSNSHLDKFEIRKLQSKFSTLRLGHVWPSDASIKYFFKFFRWKSVIPFKTIHNSDSDILYLEFTEEGRQLFPQENILNELM